VPWEASSWIRGKNKTSLTAVRNVRLGRERELGKVHANERRGVRGRGTENRGRGKETYSVVSGKFSSREIF
jgi:hypothetical protein